MDEVFLLNNKFNDIVCLIFQKKKSNVINNILVNLILQL